MLIQFTMYGLEGPSYQYMGPGDMGPCRPGLKHVASAAAFTMDPMASEDDNPPMRMSELVSLCPDLVEYESKEWDGEDVSELRLLHVSVKEFLQAQQSAHAFPSLPILPTRPDPAAGLDIHSRGNKVVKVDISTGCIAFQIGEALQIITDGRFKAVPHFVRGPSTAGDMARNTLPLFMQPDIDEVIDKEKGATYSQLVETIAERHS